MATYPSSVKSFTNPTDSVAMDEAGVYHDVQHSDLNDEVNAIEAELGANPKSIDETVAADSTPTTVAQYLDMLAYQLKVIIGGAHWYSTPPSSLTTPPAPDLSNYRPATTIDMKPTDNQAMVLRGGDGNGAAAGIVDVGGGIGITGNGGNAQFYGGDGGTGTNGNGGDVLIWGGFGDGSGTPGHLFLYGNDSVQNGGIDIDTHLLSADRVITFDDFAGTVVLDTATQTLTNKVLTSPKIDTSILDTNGKELFKLTANANAVNEVTVANAATTFYPLFAATGDDTNIDIGIKGKGTGVTRLGNAGLAFPNSDGSADQVIKTDGSGNLSFTTVTSGSTDGWTSDSHTWTYASATTFTIAGVDLTSVLTPGTKIKLTNSTVKYFYVVSSSFSTDTTVTITGGTDYSLANTAISSPYYSYQSCPQGHPLWFTWQPTWTLASGTLTTTYSIRTGKFSINGRLVTATFGMTLNVVTTATASKAFLINYPVTPTLIITGRHAIGVAQYLDSGADFNSAIICGESTSVAKLWEGNAGATDGMGVAPAKTLATNDTLSGTMSYQI